MNKPLDRGGLRYPSREFISRLWTIFKFVDHEFENLVNCSHIITDLINFLTPFLLTCPTFSCENGKSEENHNLKLCTLILWKFLNPIVKNYAAAVKDLKSKRPVISTKNPAFRKLNTLT